MPTDQERRETMLRQVILALIGAVDRRDPYAANHSARVGQLSRALAKEMNLPDDVVEAAEIAGTLMNFGKVMVSRSILTKTEAVTQDEIERIRLGILSSADILASVDFGTPVVATLRQVLERFDGTGEPEGLRGDEIMASAAIVSVANTFVALVSPRAYRDGLDFMVAESKIEQDAGKAFDPRVIVALKSLLIKGGSSLDWLAKAPA